MSTHVAYVRAKNEVGRCGMCAHRDTSGSGVGGWARRVGCEFAWGQDRDSGGRGVRRWWVIRLVQITIAKLVSIN